MDRVEYYIRCHYSGLPRRPPLEPIERSRIVDIVVSLVTEHGYFPPQSQCSINPVEMFIGAQVRRLGPKEYVVANVVDRHFHPADSVGPRRFESLVEAAKYFVDGTTIGWRLGCATVI